MFGRCPDAADIAHSIMDASDLIEIPCGRLCTTGGSTRPHASGRAAVPEAKQHEKANISDKIQGVYPIYVPNVCDIMV